MRTITSCHEGEENAIRMNIKERRHENSMATNALLLSNPMYPHVPHLRQYLIIYFLSSLLFAFVILVTATSLVVTK